MKPELVIKFRDATESNPGLILGYIYCDNGKEFDLLNMTNYEIKWHDSDQYVTISTFINKLLVDDCDKPYDNADEVVSLINIIPYEFIQYMQLVLEDNEHEKMTHTNKAKRDGIVNRLREIVKKIF